MDASGGLSRIGSTVVKISRNPSSPQLDHVQIFPSRRGASSVASETIPTYSSQLLQPHHQVLPFLTTPTPRFPPIIVVTPPHSLRHVKYTPPSETSLPHYPPAPQVVQVVCCCFIGSFSRSCTPSSARQLGAQEAIGNLGLVKSQIQCPKKTGGCLH